MALAYLAGKFNERWGQGTASYTQIRDDFAGDEFTAWMAFFEEDALWQKRREQQAEHNKLMAAARAAATRH